MGNSHKKVMALILARIAKKTNIAIPIAKIVGKLTGQFSKSGNRKISHIWENIC